MFCNLFISVKTRMTQAKYTIHIHVLVQACTPPTYLQLLEEISTSMCNPLVVT